ncbi:hypothetical protein, conserved [Plasmodium gonderi]|uniref:Growth arrest-specific protein 8 domain-containing protein n=1 Tax=Plasmodium gonderi TaxID=77519 RepID=A0A1Y1JMT3_PLAGO|nr:hypothetical protein, conserved [Plasmodium gonderi]GAW83789.1 hypothetical protein, conserved [Plasmodium gonderi]
MNKNKPKSKNKKGLKDKGNKWKNLSNEELVNLIKIQKEEYTRTVQKKHLLERRLDEKKNELECFKKEYNELKSKVYFISEGCEKYDEKHKEEQKIIKNKSVFYNFQNAEELKKLDKEKEDIKSMINQKHEQAMNNVVSFLEDERQNLDHVKNRNFQDIDELNTSFNLKLDSMEKLFTKYLEEYEHDMKDEMNEMIDNYNLIERNEIIYLNNLYNDHINNINEIHINMFQSYKEYYIEQIRENISKIKSLKMNINELEECDKEIKTELNIHSNQSSDIMEKIRILEAKREDLNKDLKFYSKDFVIFKNLELIYNENNVYIKNLREFSKNSKDKIVQVEEAFKELSHGENENIETELGDYFEEIKNKNMLLKKMVQSVDIDMDVINKELTSYIKSHNISDDDVKKVQNGITFCIETYNKELENVLYTEKRVKKKIKDTSNIYEKKMRDINVKRGI